MTPLEKAQSCGFTRLRKGEGLFGISDIEYIEKEEQE